MQAISMKKAGRPVALNTTSLRTVTTGGVSIPEYHLKELRDLLPGTLVYQSYGLSETAGAVALFKPNDLKENLLIRRKPNSVGTPAPGLSYKVKKRKADYQFNSDIRNQCLFITLVTDYSDYDLIYNSVRTN